MISPEILRRYPFFSFLTDAQRKALAMIAEEAACEGGAVIFEEGDPASDLYLLLDGSVDLYFTPRVTSGHPAPGEILVGEINPGEPFGISALIEPHIFSAAARTAKPGRILKVNGPALCALCEVDCALGYALMRQLAKAALERLHFTRIQLAAVRA
ncbi:MAG: cyclic nucleotide-binding domain-containing protein [Chloroflexi bacterium]|nr:cyclic nucleotide-binding domain-containing protein [Chloroflexota bacterium]